MCPPPTKKELEDTTGLQFIFFFSYSLLHGNKLTCPKHCSLPCAVFSLALIIPHIFQETTTSSGCAARRRGFPALCSLFFFFFKDKQPPCLQRDCTPLCKKNVALQPPLCSSYVRKKKGGGKGKKKMCRVASNNSRSYFCHTDALLHYGCLWNGVPAR